MEAEAAKLIGAGLAAIALAGAGVGIGNIFSGYLQGALRNPAAAQSQFPESAARLCPGRSNRPVRSGCCTDHSVRILRTVLSAVQALRPFR